MILLQTLDRLIPDRVNFSCPSGTIKHQRLADAFVDDIALCFTSSSDSVSFDQMVNKLQKIAQTWEHLLFLSGGKLNLASAPGTSSGGSGTRVVHGYAKSDLPILPFNCIMELRPHNYPPFAAQRLTNLIRCWEFC